MTTSVQSACERPPTSDPAVRSTAWLECAEKLKAMSHEHKASHEATSDAWERAYHLGAASALQDARLEVLATIIRMHSNPEIDFLTPAERAA